MSEFALQRVRDAEMRIADTPVPVYRETRKGTPELIGSAVLIQIADRRFICTAAHVLDERNGSNLYLPEGSMLQTFAAQFRVTQVPASGRRDDKFDFAIAELVGENGDRFARYRFLTLSDIDQDDVPRQGRIYTFAGYPASRNKSKRGTTQVGPEFVCYSGRPLFQDWYDKHGFNPSMHLVMEYDRKRMVNSDNKVVTPIDPHGVSGGAVWRLGDLAAFENGTNTEKLVGIGMEYRKEALVAVRISLVLESMRSLFGDLSPAIPRSQWIGLSVRTS